MTGIRPNHDVLLNGSTYITILLGVCIGQWGRLLYCRLLVVVHVPWGGVTVTQPTLTSPPPPITSLSQDQYVSMYTYQRSRVQIPLSGLGPANSLFIEFIFWQSSATSNSDYHQRGPIKLVPNSGNGAESTGWNDIEVIPVSPYWGWHSYSIQE